METPSSFPHVLIPAEQNTQKPDEYPDTHELSAADSLLSMWPTTSSATASGNTQPSVYSSIWGQQVGQQVNECLRKLDAEAYREAEEVDYAAVGTGAMCIMDAQTSLPVEKTSGICNPGPFSPSASLRQDNLLARELSPAEVKGKRRRTMNDDPIIGKKTKTSSTQPGPSGNMTNPEESLSVSLAVPNRPYKSSDQQSSSFNKQHEDEAVLELEMQGSFSESSLQRACSPGSTPEDSTLCTEIIPLGPLPTPDTGCPSSFASPNQDPLNQIGIEDGLSDELIDELFQILEATSNPVHLKVLCSSSRQLYGLKGCDSPIIVKPLKVQPSHWVLLVIHQGGKWATLLNSSSLTEETKKLAEKKVRNIYQKCFGEGLSNECIQYSSPMSQKNIYDSGLITFIYGWCLAAGIPYPCGQPDSNAWRDAIELVLQPLSESEGKITDAAEDTGDIVALSWKEKLEISGYISHISVEDFNQLENQWRSDFTKIHEGIDGMLKASTPIWKQEADLAPTIRWIGPLMNIDSAEQMDVSSSKRAQEARVRLNRLQQHLVRQSHRVFRLRQTKTLIERILSAINSDV